MASQPTGSSQAGWRGSRRQEVARHRWQHDPAAPSNRLPIARGPLRWLRIAGYFGLAGGLLALLVYYLLYSPARTPVLAVVATEYDWPLVPNAWAREDLAGLAELDKQTLGVKDLSEAWRSPDRGLEQLSTELAAYLHRRHTQPVIVWLSMHGAVDGAGRPCLIPPGASPHDSQTWLPLADVLAQIKAAGLPASKPKLLVLDCNRRLVDWNLGLLASTFADSLPAALAAADVPGLVILNSTSPGEMATAGSHLRGSVFGHFLRLGLAGAADGWAYGGNGNGRVSLHELTRYLQTHGAGWTLHHRGTDQHPLLVPADARDFDVAFTLRSATWHALVARAARVERAAPAVAYETLGNLWKTHDRLREGRLWRLDPVAWRNLEHDLLWLEQLTDAGSAYEAQAKSLAESLQESLSTAQTRLAAAEASGSLPAAEGVLTPFRAKRPVSAHSLPLSRFLGTVDPAVARALETQFSTCRQTPSDSAIRVALASLDEANLPGQLTEGSVLALWQRYFVPAQWADAQTLGDVLHFRLTAERLAAPAGERLAGDERAHYWLRPRAGVLDRLCRQLEDRAVLGPQAGDLQTLRDSATTAVEEASTIAADAQSTLALRDELWASLPYLAQWLTRPQITPAAQDRADLAIRQTLLPLIADGLTLETQLVRSEPAADGNTSPWAADAIAGEVAQRLEALQAKFRAEVRTLQATGSSAAAVADIDAALLLPLLPWDARQQLRQKKIDLFADLVGQYRENGNRPVTTAAATGEQAAAKAVPHAERIATRWPQHPLVALLSRIPAADAKPDDFPATEERLRQQLLTLSQGDLARLEDAATSSADAPPPPTADDSPDDAAAPNLAAWCQAESLVRAAAAIWFDPPGIDPVQSLREADLQQLLLWQASRALDDFYGPSAPGSEPLFAVAAGEYLSAAKAIAPLSPVGETQSQAIADLLARRRIAALESLATSASDILLVEQASNVSSTVIVRAKLASSLPDLPPLEGALLLADSQGRIGASAWPLTPVAAADGIVLREELLLDAAGLRERGPQIETIATLRGNEFAAPLLLRAPGGVRVAFARPTYGKPRVTVFGYENRRASVVFILDCSASMKDRTSVERPDGGVQPQAMRMDVAKGALRAMLEQLAERGNARVGVRLFGHRVGWSTQEENKLLRQTGYSEEIPPTLRPYADVEAVLPLGRFDSVVAGGVYEKLAGVQPWGETPLYLALTQALADFTAEDDSERSIVVITDGRNYQFNPPTEFQRTKDDVLAAARRTGVPITIVGFEIPEAEEATARREFEEIASASGGRFLPATGATAFVQALESLLRPGEFRVTTATGTTIDRAQLGASISLAKPTTRTSFVVGFESLTEPVELFGGEAVELAIRRDKQRLAVPAMLRGNPRFEPLVPGDGSPAPPLHVGGHRSIRSQEGVMFPLSVQNTDGHFVPRPVEMWAEISPQGMLDDVAAAPFIFYDIPADPGVSLPHYQLGAIGWPAGATRAEVRFWMKNISTAPTHVARLADVADRVPTEGIGFEVPGIPGATFQARTAGGGGQPLVIGLVERHDARSRGVDAMRVELAPPPDRVVHQFDAKNRVVLHAFTYDRPDSELKSQIEIRFTSRDAAHTGALRLAQPLSIDVSDRADLLDLSPAK
ncbi:MAG: VWA domain-containing protein [Pirellulaceae bacterium]|nr:VWA domain-containing protein [Pirellulaceae bacterium]